MSKLMPYSKSPYVHGIKCFENYPKPLNKSMFKGLPLTLGRGFKLTMKKVQGQKIDQFAHIMPQKRMKTFRLSFALLYLQNYELLLVRSQTFKVISSQLLKLLTTTNKQGQFVKSQNLKF